jgi:hypothetical protein
MGLLICWKSFRRRRDPGISGRRLADKVSASGIQANFTSYYGRLLMSTVKGDEVGSISSQSTEQSTTGSLTTSVMNYRELPYS